MVDTTISVSDLGYQIWLDLLLLKEHSTECRFK